MNGGSKSAMLIWNAIVQNKVQELAQALGNGSIDPNRPITPVYLVINRPQLGLNVLLASISEERNEITAIVLQHPDTNIDYRDYLGRSAMHYAAANGNVQAIKMLLETGGDINCTNTAGETPLMKACQFIELEAIEFLVKHKDVNILATDVNGKRAYDILNIMVSMEKGSPERMQRVSGALDLLDTRMKEEG